MDVDWQMFILTTSLSVFASVAHNDEVGTGSAGHQPGAPRINGSNFGIRVNSTVEFREILLLQSGQSLKSAESAGRTSVSALSGVLQKFCGVLTRIFHTVSYRGAQAVGSIRRAPCGQRRHIRQYAEAPKQAQRRRGAINRAPWSLYILIQMGRRLGSAGVPPA